LIFAFHLFYRSGGYNKRESLDMLVWTQAERVFRSWMLVSIGMYSVGAVGFLVIGGWIPGLLESLVGRPLGFSAYPALVEGAFWRALAVSMMAMITWISWQSWRDPRANANLVPILLLSKACSTGVYFIYFLKDGAFPYLLGMFTDGPIFVVTAFLWWMSLPGPRILSGAERRTLETLGDTLLPTGGAFPTGYRDHADACAADIARLLSAQPWFMLAYVRLWLHALEYAPFWRLRRCVRLHDLPREARTHLLEALEASGNLLVRKGIFLIKAMCVLPFFERSEACEAVGYAVPGVEDKS
jgi:hypothetical protein